MTNDHLADAWTALGLSVHQRRRIDTQVSRWLEASDTSLGGEWLALFRMAPFPAVGLLVVSALSVATAPPLIWLARALI